MQDPKLSIIEIMEKVTKKCGYERGMICGRDCLFQWKQERLEETITAWECYLNEIDKNEGHTDENRHGAWVPAIPL